MRSQFIGNHSHPFSSHKQNSHRYRRRHTPQRSTHPRGQQKPKRHKRVANIFRKIPKAPPPPKETHLPLLFRAKTLKLSSKYAFLICVVLFTGQAHAENAPASDYQPYKTDGSYTAAVPIHTRCHYDSIQAIFYNYYYHCLDCSDRHDADLKRISEPGLHIHPDKHCFIEKKPYGLRDPRNPRKDIFEGDLHIECITIQTLHPIEVKGTLLLHAFAQDRLPEVPCQPSRCYGGCMADRDIAIPGHGGEVIWRKSRTAPQKRELYLKYPIWDKVSIQAEKICIMSNLGVSQKKFRAGVLGIIAKEIWNADPHRKTLSPAEVHACFLDSLKEKMPHAHWPTPPLPDALFGGKLTQAVRIFDSGEHQHRDAVCFLEQPPSQRKIQGGNDRFDDLLVDCAGVAILNPTHIIDGWIRTKGTFHINPNILVTVRRVFILAEGPIVVGEESQLEGETLACIAEKIDVKKKAAFKSKGGIDLEEITSTFAKMGKRDEKALVRLPEEALQKNAHIGVFLLTQAGQRYQGASLNSERVNLLIDKTGMMVFDPVTRDWTTKKKKWHKMSSRTTHHSKTTPCSVQGKKTLIVTPEGKVHFTATQLKGEVEIHAEEVIGEGCYHLVIQSKRSLFHRSTKKDQHVSPVIFGGNTKIFARVINLSSVIFSGGKQILIEATETFTWVRKPLNHERTERGLVIGYTLHAPLNAASVTAATDGVHTHLTLPFVDEIKALTGDDTSLLTRLTSAYALFNQARALADPKSYLPAATLDFTFSSSKVRYQTPGPDRCVAEEITINAASATIEGVDFFATDAIKIRAKEFTERCTKLTSSYKASSATVMVGNDISGSFATQKGSSVHSICPTFISPHTVFEVNSYTASSPETNEKSRSIGVSFSRKSLDSISFAQNKNGREERIQLFPNQWLNDLRTILPTTRAGERTSSLLETESDTTLIDPIDYPETNKLPVSDAPMMRSALVEKEFSEIDLIDLYLKVYQIWSPYHGAVISGVKDGIVDYLEELRDPKYSMQKLFEANVSPRLQTAMGSMKSMKEGVQPSLEGVKNLDSFFRAVSECNQECRLKLTRETARVTTFVVVDLFLSKKAGKVGKKIFPKH